MTRTRTIALLILCTTLACSGSAPVPASGSAAEAEKAPCTPRECSYLPAPSEAVFEPEPGPHPDCCCTRADGSLQVQPGHLRRMQLDENGLATVFVPGLGVAYVRRDGKSTWVHPFDNGADSFVEGLARTVQGSRIGFVDTSLDIVIEPAWDFAFPFSNGVALVCQGCQAVPVGPGDEHQEVVGGTWGYIDRAGKVVVPVTYARDRLPPPPA